MTTVAQATGSSGERGWRQVEGAWVLAPPGGVTPRAVVHFIGGAFVGASPQLTYRLFLEALTSRGSLLVVATPFGIGFDHLRIADETQFRFDRCIRTLSDEVLKLVTLHPKPYTRHPTPHTLHPTPYTLYSIPYTLYPIPYTLYPIPYTLYPILCTLYPIP
jgi:hypothetical protein